MLEIGDLVTTSPKAHGRFELPGRGVARVDGLGRYKVGVDGIDRLLPGSKASPLLFLESSREPFRKGSGLDSADLEDSILGSPPGGVRAGKVQRHQRHGSPKSMEVPRGIGAQIQVIEGRVHLNRDEWPAPFPVHEAASLDQVGRIDAARDAVVQVAFLAGGWVRLIGPARLALDAGVVALEQGEMLIKDLAGRRIRIGPYTIDPGDYLVSFKIGKTIRIKSLEGLIPIRGERGRQMFLAPGREVIFDTIHAEGKTQTTDIRQTLMAWNHLFTEALNRRQIERNAEKDRSRDRDAEMDETPLTPEVEPRRHHRLSLRERVHAVGHFENQWFLNRKREYERAQRHVAFLNEARRRDPDSSVKAFELYKARSRLRLAHQSLTELKRDHTLVRKGLEFEEDEGRRVNRVTERERLFGQPFKMQTRRSILALGRISEQTGQAVDGLTNQIDALQHGGTGSEDIATLEARRQSFLDSLQRVIDQTDAALRTDSTPALFHPDI